jgi:4-amino-4-deoxy-L-arabinose transferase-like glycosyltransferase
MIARRPLALACAIAALHALFFIWYQRPDWSTEWSDQEGYRRLGQVLAETGRFTRYPAADPFVPEVIRTPMYPMFVAAVYRVFGVHQIAVALAQAALFAGICLLAYATARPIVPARVATAAAFAVALFPPIPYFGALVMTEVWTTFWLTTSIWLALRAARGCRLAPFAALGASVAVVALSRPAFALLPLALAAVGWIALPLTRPRSPSRPATWAVMIAVFAVAMLPWFAYNYRATGRVTLSPAGGVGRGLWEGSWQATWRGRVQDELTHLAERTDDPAELDRRVAAVAAREGESAAPMLEYVHQWRALRRIWDEPTDPHARAFARVAADRAYLHAALDNLRRAGPAHLARRLARGVFVLWAGEIPIRYSDINRVPPALVWTLWTAQAMILGLALVGIVRLARAGRTADAWLLATPIAYITIVHFPLFTEARQSLPAMPVVLLLATVGAIGAVSPSFALEAEVHEREHL